MARKQEASPDYPPSRDLAWMLGVVAAGGCVDKRQVMLCRPDSDLQAAFASNGEEIFGVDPHFVKDKTSDHTPRFVGTGLARWFGDLKRLSWPDTLQEKHGWVLDNNNWLWGFLEGFYEVRGQVVRTSSPGIRYRTSYQVIANTLAEFLRRVELRNPSISLIKGGRQVLGVDIANIPDQLIFANNIHPKVTQKELDLDSIRQRSILSAKASYRSDEELVAEWKRVAEMLGHTPTGSELRSLKQEGKTLYSDKVYRRRFGGGRGYSLTVDSLIELSQAGR